VRGRIKAARTAITVCALETCCGKGSAVGRLNVKEGVSFLLAEQNTNMALKYASHGYILESGRVVMDGEARALAANEDVKEFYLGVAGDKRKSFRDGKHDKRRKRWLILAMTLSDRPALSGLEQMQWNGQKSGRGLAA
jgi:hypothetical protein